MKLNGKFVCDLSKIWKLKPTANYNTPLKDEK